MSVTNAAARLLARKELIVGEWLARVRTELPAASQEREPVIVDTLPVFLRGLAEALSPDSPRPLASAGSTAPGEHSSERARVTRYRPEDLVHEYQLLRDVLLEKLSESQPLEPREQAIIRESLDRALRESCAAYFRAFTDIRAHLTAALTHDLRNPLFTARANAELIQRQADSAKVSLWAGRIVANLDRADGMIQDALDTSRLRAGERLPLTLEPLELGALVREAVSQLTAVHGARFLVTAPEPVHGYWSAQALRRALENLCGNAVKYGLEGKPITVSVRETHGRALVTVHNHGPAIPPEEREALFSAFRRTSSAEESGKRGWGMGLAVVRAVAEAHGGSVVIDSVEERGTSFTLNVPCDARPFQPPVH